MTDVIMPQMGESIAEGTLTKWLKNVGDAVERDEPLFEISTDKVDAEIPAPAAGVLKEIRVQPGETVEVNTVVGVIEAGAAAGTDAPAAAEVVPAAAAEAAAPAAAPTAPAPAPPAPPAAPTPAPAPEPSRSRAEMSAEELRQLRSSPVVRRIAAEHEVDLRQLSGSGISGRVTKQDILDHLAHREDPEPPDAPEAPAPERPGAAAATPAPPAPATPTVPAYLPGEAVELVPMSPIRRKTAEHMLLSKRISAHVSTVFEVDMSRVDELRRKHRASYEERNGVRLTYLPFFATATIDALKEFPILNASVDGDNIVYRKEINLGIAVALDWGLIVPVIRGADEKNILGLTRALGDLAERARSRKLKVDEVQGGTFTITNPGVFGSLFGTPIINQPQVAILGVGTIEKRPVVREDAIAIRTMTYLALTFDHRIVDGADADRFMARIKQGLQEFDPAAL
jgi:2-oxoglutarate dehydrogenase E2 component (dihydrolipoamide succinyltransferase)